MTLHVWVRVIKAAILPLIVSIVLIIVLLEVLNVLVLIWVLLVTVLNCLIAHYLLRLGRISFTIL